MTQKELIKLQAIGQQRRGATLSEISELLGIPKQTITEILYWEVVRDRS